MSWLDTLSEVRDKDWSKAPDAERAAAAKEVVNICGYAAAATSVVPIPLADIVLLLPVHSVMVMTVGHCYGRKLSGAEAKRVVLELGSVAGLTFAGGAAINALRKLFLPAIGGLLAVPATFALTWGLGRVAIAYFENPSLSRDDLKKVFDDAIKEGKNSFSKEALEKFMRKNEGVKAEDPETAEKPQAKKPETAPPPPPPKKDPPKTEPPKTKKRTL
jgi:uncharacterized protein (DUF697 family)